MSRIIKVSILVFSLLAVNEVYSQHSAKTSAGITVRIIRGLSLTTEGLSKLDFGDIVTTDYYQTSQIANQNGQKFKAIGHPKRNINVSYDYYVTLSNKEWASLNGGEAEEILFTTNPIEFTGKSSVYKNPRMLSSKSSVTLENSRGVGVCYLWVGGKITVANNQSPGVYKGDFNITISY